MAISPDKFWIAGHLMMIAGRRNGDINMGNNETGISSSTDAKGVRRESRFTKAEKSWIMYDWANSVYATIIMAAVFPMYFSAIAKSYGMPGDVYWGYTTSASTFIVAIAAPFLGAIGDFKGFKKKLFTAFMIAGTLFTLLMAISDRPFLMLAGYGISYIGFAGANLFYDSFLTDVTTPDRMDRVSSYGYAMGYIGGSTIPFLMAIVLIMFGKGLGVDNTLAVKLSVVLTTIWWLVFSIPILRNVKQEHYVDTPPTRLGQHAFSNLRLTIKNIINDRKLLMFIVAYFFYIDGVGTVIHMATSYGSTLGLGTTGMILALLVTQLVAVPFSIFFSKLASRIGSINMLKIGIAVYITVCISGFYMGFSLEPHQFAYEDNFTAAVGKSADKLAYISESDKSRIIAESMAILSDPGRVESFTEIADNVIKETTGGSKAQADLEKLKADVSGFLGDNTQSADYEKALDFSSKLFWVLALLVGTSQGGMQALSRSFFGKLIPPERSNEYFGFFDIFGKFAAVIGPALYALFASLTGRSSIGILSLIALFIVGFFALTAAGRAKAGKGL